MRSANNIHSRLFDFFSRHFDAVDFRLLLRRAPSQHTLLDELPSESAPKREIISTGLDVLIRHGLIGDQEIWQHVQVMRPRLAGEIRKLVADFGFSVVVMDSHLGSAANDRSVDPKRLPSREAREVTFARIQAVRIRVSSFINAASRRQAGHVALEAVAGAAVRRLMPRGLAGPISRVARKIQEETKGERRNGERKYMVQICDEVERVLCGISDATQHGKRIAGWRAKLRRIRGLQQPTTQSRHLDVLLAEMTSTWQSDGER